MQNAGNPDPPARSPGRGIAAHRVKLLLRLPLARIEEQPIAAASIAQVHRATLLTGEDVVVKVQRPRLPEVIAADLRILSARPGSAQEARAPHRLYGFLDAAERGSVARWRDLALAEITASLSAGRRPVLVGGTGLYMSVLVDGIFKANSQNEAIRRRFYQEASRCGSSHLYKKLQVVDAEAALKIHPHELFFL